MKVFGLGSKKLMNETGCVVLDGVQVPFLLTRSKRRKRTVAFHMQSDGVVRIMAPNSLRSSQVAKIMQDHASWVTRKLGERLTKSEAGCDFSDGSSLSYLGHKCKVHITSGGGEAICRLRRFALHIHVPDHSLSPQGVCAEAKLSLTLWLKKRARIVLKRRMDLWSSRMGLVYTRLLVNGPERRWGSCSADDVIRLNWRLMLAPLPVIDYVVVHELAHIRHRNHGPLFWGLVSHYMPKWQTQRKCLRNLELHSPL